MKRWLVYFSDLPFRAGFTGRLVRFLLVCAILIPILLTGALNYTTTYTHLTQVAMARREATAYLAAMTLKESFKRLNDVAQLALGTRVQFYQLVRTRQWKEAFQVLRTLPKDVPFMTRVLLADPTGALAGEKEKMTELSQKDPGFKKWYTAGAQDGAPYISPIYLTEELPRQKVIALAIPIRPSASKLEGILILEIQLDKLFAWTQEMNVGPSGFLYFVDRNGHVAAHPKYSSGSELVDFSSVPEVQKVLRGEKGVGTFFNPVEKEKQVTAYEPVPDFEWGAIAGQPATAAFALRDHFLRRLMAIYSVVLVLAAGLVIFMLYAIRIRRRTEESLKKAHEELEAKVRERTQELAEANAKLQTSNIELEQFAFVASHDLQAPVQKIVGFGDLLLEKSSGALNEQSRDYLRRIRSAALRMSELVQKLLELSRVSTQTQPFETVDLESVAREALSDFESRIAELGARVEIQGQWPSLPADRVQMRQLLENLMANALKFRKKDVPPHVILKCQTKNSFAEIVVEDNGIGFDENQRERIFRPFERLHRQDEYEGSGIGLATCQKIVTRHGGRITASSIPGKGSAFTLLFPLFS